LFAHPAFQKSRVHRLLREGVRDLPGVSFHDLYEAYPDLDIDVEEEQRLLLEH
jgi:glutathione-regulated potassium-efflux system ancillary protein KefG